LNTNFVKAKNLLEALENLNSGRGTVLAGGTDIMVELHERNLSVENIIDISNLTELRGINIDQEKVIILSGSTHGDIEKDEIIKNKLPILADACRSVGSTLIRNRGTIGGNIVNNASCADSIPPLLLLDSTVTLKSLNNEREVCLQDFLDRCGKVNLNREEILYSINVKPLNSYRYKFIKVGRRKSLAISRLTLAIALKDNNGVIEDLRICPGAMLGKPTRLYETEKKFKGEVLKKSINSIAEEALKEVIALSGKRWSSEYKEPVLRGLIIRTLEEWGETL
jgi:carbon-monoxide dehydrogenase medium subunit/xanthine dehydrogenase FAD-binding subunit